VQQQRSVVCGLDTSVLGLLLHLKWPCFHAHSPDWESARKRRQATHHRQLSFVPREQCEYKRGETRTFPQSPLSQHRQQSLRHVAASYTGGGRIEDLRNRTRDGASYLWRLDLSWTVGRQCKEGGNTEHMRRRHSTHRDEFAAWFIKTRMGLIINGGTFSKCGLPTTQYHIQSFFSSMHISLYNLLDPLIQQCNISQFFIYFLLVKMNFLFYTVEDLVNLGWLVLNDT